MAEIRFPAWDPVLLDLPGPIDLRWYGLMYVFAFLAGYYILGRQARSGLFPLPQEKVGDLIFVLIFGVILGGRLGYIFFYHPEYLQSWQVFKVWEGGLSFHGGLLGVALAVVWFARRYRIPAARLSDCVAMATTPGIFFVRMANFINGELWGRTTDESVSWAMRFPRDPAGDIVLHLREVGDMRTQELVVQYAFEQTEEAWKRLLAQAEPARHSFLERIRAELDWDQVMHQVPLRHPSQLYEGLAEGLVLGLLLWLLYRMTKGRLAAGVYGAFFLLGYGVFRWPLELYRQPDVGVAYLLGMTRGQLLCSGMVLAALVWFWWCWRRRGPDRGTEGEVSP